MGKRGITPNWISENDWSAKKRLEWANKIMAFSPRDWSINFNSGDKPESPDSEIWALWCLITNDTKEEALEAWWGFCDDNANTYNAHRMGDRGNI
jgi:hypothetical protein